MVTTKQMCRTAVAELAALYRTCDDPNMQAEIAKLAIWHKRQMDGIAIAQAKDYVRCVVALASHPRWQGIRPAFADTPVAPAPTAPT